MCVVLVQSQNGMNCVCDAQACERFEYGRLRMFLCCFALVGHFELLELQNRVFRNVADGRRRECWVKEIHFVVSAFSCMLLIG